jgi:phenylacetic acid degradation operon negative regulatory protein
MGSLGGGVWIGPHPDREPLVSAALEAAGVNAKALSFRADSGSIGVTEDVVGAWALEELAREYDAFVNRFADVRPADPAAAYRAQTELVHAWRRFAFLDPNLPRELLPPDWPRPRAHQLFRHCHEAWADGAQSHFAALEALRAHAAQDELPSGVAEP